MLAFLVSAPHPSNVQTVLGTKCLDLGHHMHKKSWFWARGSGACESVEKLSDRRIQSEGITADEIVFTWQVPLPRGGQEMHMSRWFQNIVSVLQAEIDYEPAYLQGRYYSRVGNDVYIHFFTLALPFGLSVRFAHVNGELSHEGEHLEIVTRHCFHHSWVNIDYKYDFVVIFDRSYK